MQQVLLKAIHNFFICRRGVKYILWARYLILCGFLVDNISPKKQALLLEEVQKLNKENAEKSGQLFTPLDLESGVAPEDEQAEAPTCNLLDYEHEDFQAAVTEKPEVRDVIEEQIMYKELEEKAALTEKAVDDVVQQKPVEEEKPAVPEELEKENIFASEEEIKISAVPASDEDKKEVANRYDHIQKDYSCSNH